MTSLRAPGAAYAGDRGEPDEAVRSALARADAGTEAYLAAVAAACGARLLLPIVATEDDGGSGPDPDRQAELAAVLTTSASGATGVLAFTGLDALQAFDASARPVPCTLDEVAATALETRSAAVVLDLHGPYRLVIEEPLLSRLAAGERLVRTDEGWGWLSLRPASGAGDSPRPGPTG